MKKKRSLFFAWVSALLLLKLLWLSVLGADYIRAVWQMRLPVFARKVFGDGSSLRTYRGLGYKVNVRGSFAPTGEPEGPAMLDFYLFGQRIGGAYKTE